MTLPVYLKNMYNTIFYLSPGCSITETVTRGSRSIGRKGAKQRIFYLPTDKSHIIRIDTKIATCGNWELDGISNEGNPPYWGSGSDSFAVDAFLIELDLYPLNANWYLYMRGMYYTGLIRSAVITQRSGEGDMVDVSITFEAGTVSGTT